jgi:hypothetical protein
MEVMQNFIMRPTSAFLPKVILFLFACLLAGCSALRLGYTNGDTFMYWWTNSYVEFTDEQRPWVRGHIQQLMSWHRKTQLKDYAQLLTRAQQRLQQPVTNAEVQAEYTELRKRAMLVIDKALPNLTELALSLQPHQIDNMEEKFASNNESYRKEYLRGDLERRQRFRFQKVMKQAEYWFGEFTAEQEAQIRAASDARPMNNELWMAERQKRQQELIAILKRFQAERPSKEAAMATLKQYVNRNFEYFTYADNKAFFDDSRAGTVQMVTTIINIATPAQKEHAMKRLQKWINDCNELAAQ